MSDTRNIYQRTADEVIAGKEFVFEAPGVDELRDFQRRIHTYAYYRGYRLTTQKDGLKLKVRAYRAMLQREVDKLHHYSPTRNKFRAGRQLRDGDSRRSLMEHPSPNSTSGEKR